MRGDRQCSPLPPRLLPPRLLLRLLLLLLLLLLLPPLLPSLLLLLLASFAVVAHPEHSAARKVFKLRHVSDARSPNLPAMACPSSD